MARQAITYRDNRKSISTGRGKVGRALRRKHGWRLCDQIARDITPKPVEPTSDAPSPASDDVAIMRQALIDTGHTGPFTLIGTPEQIEAIGELPDDVELIGFEETFETPRERKNRQARERRAAKKANG